jgi:predicted DCC family thiol-disulfide oxidoreductase YuxK
VENTTIGARPVPWLVFDGDCAFCTSTVTWLAARLHRPGRPEARTVPWQFTDLAALGTDPVRAQREVLWVAPDGSVRGGAEAFAAWLRLAGGGYGLLGRSIALPGVRTVAGAVYRWVARHRDRMPGGSPACALPPPGFDPARPGTRPV